MLVNNFAKRFAALACAVCLLAAVARADGDGSKPGAKIGDVLAVETSGKSVDVQGTVVESFYEKAIVIRDDSGIICVAVGKAKEAPTVHRGDLIRVEGVTYNQETFRTVIDAAKVSIIKPSGSNEPGTRARDINALQLGGRAGEVVTVIGTVKAQKGERVWIQDKSGTIWADAGERFRKRVVPEGETVAVIGEVVKAASTEVSLNILGMVELADLEGMELSPVDMSKVEKLSTALNGVKAGQQITTKGRVMKFIGKKIWNVLYDGRDQLVIDLASGNAADLESGEEVAVSGMLDFIEYKGKTYPVVRQAKIAREPVSAKN